MHDPAPVQQYGTGMRIGHQRQGGGNGDKCREGGCEGNENRNGHGNRDRGWKKSWNGDEKGEEGGGEERPETYVVMSRGGSKDAREGETPTTNQ